MPLDPTTKKGGEGGIKNESQQIALSVPVNKLCVSMTLRKCILSFYTKAAIRSLR